MTVVVTTAVWVQVGSGVLASFSKPLYGLHDTYYTLQFHKLPLEGDRGLDMGSYRDTHALRREGRAGDSPGSCWGGCQGPITRQIVPPGCSQTRRGQI